MPNGDDCGAHGKRETKVLNRIFDLKALYELGFLILKVYFECSNNSSFISEITEPKTCNYKVIFKTPLVCHSNSLLVYPNLNQNLQKEWDNRLTEFQNSIITEKVGKFSFSKTSKLKFTFFRNLTGV
jgi:hypothetical protein